MLKSEQIIPVFLPSVFNLSQILLVLFPKFLLICSIVSKSTVATLVQAYIISGLDYYSSFITSLFFNLNSLEIIQNSSTGPSLLKTFHQLPMFFWVVERKPRFWCNGGQRKRVSRNWLKYIYIYFFCFLGLHLQHMEAPRLRVESELQLLGYAMATAQDNTEFLTYLVSQELNPHPHGY